MEEEGYNPRDLSFSPISDRVSSREVLESNLPLLPSPLLPFFLSLSTSLALNTAMASLASLLEQSQRLQQSHYRAENELPSINLGLSKRS